MPLLAAQSTRVEPPLMVPDGRGIDRLRELVVVEEIEFSPARVVGEVSLPKWQIDQAALVAKLTAADYGTCLAIIDANEQFWADTSPPEEGGWRPLVAKIVGEKHIAKEEHA
jgi:hypothetical protein